MHPLIFLPGASGQVKFWHPLLKCMAQHQHFDAYSKHVIAYAGFAEQAPRAEVFDFASLQTDVLDQIQKLSSQQQGIIVAQSMGGIFAIQAALKLPHQIRALILMATSGGIDLSDFDVEDWREDARLKSTTPDWFRVHHDEMDDRLADIQCPILLLWGSHDPISPVSVGKYLQQHLPHATLKIIGAGQHDFANAFAAQVRELIQTFLSELNLRA